MFSIVRNVISVSSVKSQVTKTFKKSENFPKIWKLFKNQKYLENLNFFSKYLIFFLQISEFILKIWRKKFWKSDFFRKFNNFLKIWIFWQMLNVFQKSVNFLKTQWIQWIVKCSKIKSGSVSEWVSQSVSDKVTYWAVRWQLKTQFWANF